MCELMDVLKTVYSQDSGYHGVRTLRYKHQGWEFTLMIIVLNFFSQKFTATLEIDS